MIEGGTRDTNITTAVNDVEKTVFENLADAYDCSQSAYNRMAAMRHHRELFGDIHPEALHHPEVDKEALLRGDLEPEDVPAKFRMEGDQPAEVPTADGGVSEPVQPSSYTPTHTPQDLATSGPELTWDELKSAIGRHFDGKSSDGDDEQAPLEIHPDRVRPSVDVDVGPDDSYSHDDYALKANKSIVAKILAGLLRSNGDVITQQQLDVTILTYTDHQITRADVHAGKEYKKQTYRKLMVKKGYLAPHPDPLEDKYYTSERAANELFGTEVEDTIRDLLDTTWALDPRQHVQQTSIPVKEDASQWIADLATFRQRLGFLQAVTTTSEWSDRLEEMDDPVNDAPNALVTAGKTFNELLQTYVKVNQWARFAVAHAELDVQEDDMLTDNVYRDGESMTVNADRPSEPHTKWVVQRSQPLSPDAQIDAVTEKL